jgi:hypothetical protein
MRDIRTGWLGDDGFSTFALYHSLFSTGREEIEADMRVLPTKLVESIRRKRFDGASWSPHGTIKQMPFSPTVDLKK